MFAEYLQKQEQFERLREELEKLENDERLQSELKVKSELEDLMRRHDKTARDIILMLDPQGKVTGESQDEVKQTRRKRKLKIYTNPHTGEVVETRGGNQKTLNAWKNEFGAETVESWLTRTED